MAKPATAAEDTRLTRLTQPPTPKIAAAEAVVGGRQSRARDVTPLWLQELPLLF